MFNQFQNPQADFYRQQMNSIAQPIPQQPINQMQPQTITRAVTGVEEARNSIIDPMSTNLFTDFANGKIYVKKINNNGLAEFYSFALEQETVEPKADPNAEIKERLDRIENLIKGEKNVKPNNEPNANTKPTSLPKGNGNGKG